METKTLSMQTAIEAFLRGFSTTRSFTKPFEIREVGQSIWMLADAPGAKLPTRTPEFIAYGADPAAVVEAVARQKVERYALCVLLDDAAELPDTIATFKGYGHRYHGREPMFVLDTAERVAFESVPIRRVVTLEEAAAVAKAARSRQILPAHLEADDSICRLYAAYDGDTPVGWVRSIRTHTDCAWVASMFVRADYRRRGIGRSLLSGLLDDDARLGVRWSVLLASLTGAMLYPHLGYREQGALQIFTPLKTE